MFKPTTPRSHNEQGTGIHCGVFSLLMRCYITRIPVVRTRNPFFSRARVVLRTRQVSSVKH